MPELPEVETQVRDLQAVVGKKILAITSDTHKAWKPNFAASRQLVGKKILSITRRAKYLIFKFSGRVVLVAHFRMTGHFLIAKSATPLERFIRHSFALSSGIFLQFSDIRKFGTLTVCAESSHEKFCKLVDLGIEPLEKNFTLAALKQAFQNKKGMLKALLLNQSIIAGIGNIYADEICFNAKFHPASRVENLTAQDFVNLHKAIQQELKKGVKNRGTTIGEYVDTLGKHGKNQLSLRAYKQHGKPCSVCGGIMQKMKISQRTTSFCAHCQRKK
jgi:formamidopyrimidine-DNA glycosylase